ncbi:S8 family serine peptidase [Duganella sp. Root1480D1]|uniref:S8 family serine peptidase n=1 Tax=Duganella sp. Root1480D1 TaxID=1736471 RepID=UPI00070C89E0|nr:S8 family serine peptidase [Duganella sp. Root1480D1]KQZ28025.1 peptidase S8 [Duganella sp. Root1480D1]
MKKLNTILSLLLAASAPLAVAAPADFEADYAEGRIIVEPQAGITADEFEKSLKSFGAGKAQKLGQSNIHVIDVPHGSEKAIANKLKHNPHFKFAELDVRVPVAATLNDPYLGSEWHIAKIGAPSAWDSTQGAGITIAILDTGVDGTHPDLAPRMVAGRDIYGNSADTSDLCGHGTAVAGAAAAAGNNATGVSGVSGQSKIMPLRIAYKGSDGLCYAYASTIASGVTYAADHGAKVVNVSFSNAPNSTAVQSAGNYLKGKGGLLFVSANNNNRDEGFTPSTALIAVSSTDAYDNRSSFSSYGAFVSLSAPGSNIYTTNKGGSYGAWNGTSFASPVAAGAAALVMAANPSLTADQVQNILFTTAVDLGTAGRDIYFGYGRVNAAAAVLKAKGSTQVVADTSSPTVAIAAPLGSSTVSGLVPVSVNAADNVGVARVELKVNSTVVATDTSAPFAFSWDSKGVANGMASLTAIAYDSAGNVTSSSPVSVNVANSTTTIVTTDTTPPTVRVTNPVAGRVNGNVTVSLSASDNKPASELAVWIYIDGALKASGTGSSLSYNWQTNREPRGTHVVKAVAKDKAGNTSSYSVSVTR